jgi:hypothetical protein
LSHCVFSAGCCKRFLNIPSLFEPHVDHTSTRQVAVAYELSKPTITAPIVGTTNLESLAELAHAVKIRLTEDEIKARVILALRSRCTCGGECWTDHTSSLSWAVYRDAICPSCCVWAFLGNTKFDGDVDVNALIRKPVSTPKRTNLHRRCSMEGAELVLNSLKRHRTNGSAPIKNVQLRSTEPTS